MQKKKKMQKSKKYLHLKYENSFDSFLPFGPGYHLTGVYGIRVYILYIHITIN